MKAKFLGMALALAAFGSATAQEYTHEDSVAAYNRMMHRLLGFTSTDASAVQTVEPFVENQYIYLGDENASVVSGSRSVDAKVTTNAMEPFTDLVTNSLKPSISYLYSVSASGHVRNGRDNVFTVYFSKDQYQIVKHESGTNKCVESVVWNYTNKEIPDLTSTDFLNPLRCRSTNAMDIINGYVSNDTRRNEVFQGFIDVAVLDYDGDMVDDLFLVMGNTLSIYGGTRLEKITSYKLIDDTNCGPASAVYDFNNDGINDYLLMLAHTPSFAGHNKLQFDGIMLVSEYNKETNTVSYKRVEHKFKASDLSDGGSNTLRATMKMEMYYPEGKSCAPKLAVAVSEIVSNGQSFNATDTTGVTPEELLEKGKYVDGFDPNASDTILTGASNYRADFKQYLTIIQCDPKLVGLETADNWYACENRTEMSYTCDHRTSSGYTFGYLADRRRPFLFGRPALCAASMVGVEEPQNMFWVDRLCRYSATTKKFDVVYEMPDKHTSAINNEGFDRVIGGQMQACKVGDTEKLVYLHSVSYTKKDIGTFCDDFDWNDKGYSLATLYYDGTDYQYVSNSNLTTREGSNPQSLGLTKMNCGTGAKVKLVKKEVSCSTPIVLYVLAAPPYITDKTISKGSISFTKNESESETDTDSHTTTLGLSVNVGGTIFPSVPWFKFGVTGSVNYTWGSSRSQTYRISESRSSGSSDGEDFVVYNYMYVDKFTYEVTECDNDPSVVGSQFEMVKVRDSGLMQRGESVSAFNEMVKGTSCPQIGKDVLPHTVGDVTSYKGGLKDNDEIRKAFNIGEKDFLRVSTSVETPRKGALEKLSLSYSEGASESESGTLAIDIALQFGFEPASKVFSICVQPHFGWGNTWCHTKAWDKSYTLDAVLPNVEDPEKNDYVYCLVWYQHHDDRKVSDIYLQDYMVGNWYILDTNFQEPGAVENIDGDAKTVKSVKYYDSLGRVFSQPVKGFCVKVTDYTDGTHSTEKTVE